MAKRLIINCDDFGQSPAMNRAIMHLLEEGKVSSATIMAVAPGFEEAADWAARRQQPNVGLHLTLTSEFDALRWSSLTGHPSLHDAEGKQYRTVREFELGAETGAVVKEIDAQYERVKQAGIRISHVDNHMGSLYGMETGRSLLPQTFWKISRWGLPSRFFRYIHPDDPLLRSLSGIERPVAKAAALADTFGVPIPDYLLSHPFGLVEGKRMTASNGRSSPSCTPCRKGYQRPTFIPVRRMRGCWLTFRSGRSGCGSSGCPLMTTLRTA